MSQVLPNEKIPQPMSDLGNLKTCRPQLSTYEGFLYGLSGHCFFVAALQKIFHNHLISFHFHSITEGGPSAGADLQGALYQKKH